MAVAVLIVNFRVYDDLDRSLTALYPFLSPDDEIVVVDNESQRDRLVSLAAKHPRMLALPRRENIGFAAAINLAARNSTRPFLLLLNPDAVVQGPVPRALEQWLIDHPNTAVAGPRILNADDTVQASARRFPGISAALGGRSTWLSQRYPNNWFSRRHLLGLTSETPLDVDWIAGSCMMTTRAAFEQVGGFDEQFFLYWEDADYCRRLKNMGLKTTYLPSVTVKHAGGHSADQVRTLAISAFHSSALRLHLKHGGFPARITAPLANAAMRGRQLWRVRQAARASHP